MSLSIVFRLPLQTAWQPVQSGFSHHLFPLRVLALSVACSSPRSMFITSILVRFARPSQTRKSLFPVSSSVEERLDEAMILFNQIVEVFHLPQFHVRRRLCRQNNVGIYTNTQILIIFSSS